jgi:hypothetical protein
MYLTPRITSQSAVGHSLAQPHGAFGSAIIVASYFPLPLFPFSARALGWPRGCPGAGRRLCRFARRPSGPGAWIPPADARPVAVGELDAGGLESSLNYIQRCSLRGRFLVLEIPHRDHAHARSERELILVPVQQAASGAALGRRHRGRIFQAIEKRKP